MEDMMKVVCRIALVALFVSGLAGPAALEAKKELPDLDTCYREIRELRADINLLNLYNGMHLTVEQIEIILAQARKVARERGPVKEAVPIEELKEELVLLDEVRRKLHAGKDVSTTYRARYDNMMRQRSRSFMKAHTHEMRACVEQCAAAVEGALTDSQIEVLATFKPCLIPPKDLKDPVRVGQASDGSRFVPLVEKIRSIPKSRYGAGSEKIIEHLVNLAEKHMGKMRDDDREAYRQRLRYTFHKARSMTEEEFLFNKQELADGIEPPDQIGQIKEKLEKMGVPRFAARGQIAQYFLTPRAIPILERRLEQMKRFEREGQVDLDDLKGAKTCRDGKCAID